MSPPRTRRGRPSGRICRHPAQLDQCLVFIREGDVLVVTRLDRLARSTAHVLQIVETIEKKARRSGCSISTWIPRPRLAA
jgi:DNA invertase Pin-like site-specific DNA recombinase